MSNKKIIINGNITYDELKKVLEDVLYEFFDPDYGLEVRKEFKTLIEKSLKEKKDKKLYTIKEVEKKNWICMI